MATNTSTPLPTVPELVSKLREAGVIPDVVPDSVNLKGVLEVVYPSGVAVVAGTEPPRDSVTAEPSIRFHPPSHLDSSASYTILMSDPDLMARNDPTNKQVRHWVASGLKVPSSASTTDPTSNNPTYDLSKRDVQTHTSFLGSAPMPMTGAHRYVFVLAKENQPLPKGEGDRPADFKERLGFVLEEFVKEHQLEIVGVSYMQVAPSMSSGVENVKLMAQTAVHAVTGQ